MPIKLTEFKKYQQKLRAYFPPQDLQWKVGATSRDNTKGIALAYLDSSAVMDRLDEVLGPENWTKKHAWGEKGEIMCGISILFEYPDGSLEWHTKWDAGVQPEFEPEKGGISDSLKRAANCWGIGRYLRKVPTKWLPIEKKGKRAYFKSDPQLPADFLPENHNGSKKAKSSSTASNFKAKSTNSTNNTNSNRKRELTQILNGDKKLALMITNFLNKHGYERVSELTPELYSQLKSMLFEQKNHSA